MTDSVERLNERIQRQAELIGLLRARLALCEERLALSEEQRPLRAGRWHEDTEHVDRLRELASVLHDGVTRVETAMRHLWDEIGGRYE